MDWLIFWTIVAQVSIGAVVLAFISYPLRLFVENIVRGATLALPIRYRQAGELIFRGETRDD